MRKAYIFPTYNETETLPTLLRQMTKHLGSEDLIIIADDSETEEHEKIKKLVQQTPQTIVLRGRVKGGRGLAVWNSLKWLYENDRDNYDYFIEADCDGSHRVEDIMRVAQESREIPFVIGSRYLEGSKIHGWSFSRRVMSKVLNYLIPRILSLNIADITNGLRRYNKIARNELLKSVPTNPGFIYLSEQALQLHKAGLTHREIEIIFESRIAGKSSVTLKDLLNSMKGLFQIYRISKNK